MPRWQILSGVRAEISSPLNRMEPAVAGKAPEMQLNMVVLPEPLGPMRPRISPSTTSNETRLRAVKPPNRLVRPETVSTGRRGTGAGEGSAPGAGWSSVQRAAHGEAAGSGRMGAAVATVLG